MRQTWSGWLLFLTLAWFTQPVIAGPFVDAGEVFVPESVSALLKDVDAYSWVGPEGNLAPGGAWRLCYKAPFAGLECPMCANVVRFHPIALEIHPPADADLAEWAARLDRQLRNVHRTPEQVTFRGLPASRWSSDEFYLYRTDPPDETVFWVVRKAEPALSDWLRVHPTLEVAEVTPGGGKTVVEIRNTAGTPFTGTVPIAVRSYTTQADGEKAWQLFFSIKAVSGVQGFQALADRTSMRQRFLSGTPTSAEQTVIWTNAITIPAHATQQVTITHNVKGVTEVEILDPAALTPVG